MRGFYQISCCRLSGASKGDLPMFPSSRCGKFRRRGGERAREPSGGQRRLFSGGCAWRRISSQQKRKALHIVQGCICLCCRCGRVSAAGRVSPGGALSGVIGLVEGIVAGVGSVAARRGGGVCLLRRGAVFFRFFGAVFVRPFRLSSSFFSRSTCKPGSVRPQAPRSSICDCRCRQPLSYLGGF